jgi:hypothetical protein
MSKISAVLMFLILISCDIKQAMGEEKATISGIWKFPDGKFYLCNNLSWGPRDLRFFNCKLMRDYKPDYSKGIVCIHGICTEATQG